MKMKKEMKIVMIDHLVLDIKVRSRLAENLIQTTSKISTTSRYQQQCQEYQEQQHQEQQNDCQEHQHQHHLHQQLPQDHQNQHISIKRHASDVEPQQFAGIHARPRCEGRTLCAGGGNNYNTFDDDRDDNHNHQIMMIMMINMVKIIGMVYHDEYHENIDGWQINTLVHRKNNNQG